eukprot:355791-Chlamydomonas_euryale.AAC.12
MPMHELTAAGTLVHELSVAETPLHGLAVAETPLMSLRLHQRRCISLQLHQRQCLCACSCTKADAYIHICASACACIHTSALACTHTADIPCALLHVRVKQHASAMQMLLARSTCACLCLFMLNSQRWPQPACSDKSSLEKVFDYFSSQETPEGIKTMLPQDLLQVGRLPALQLRAACLVYQDTLPDCC